MPNHISPLVIRDRFAEHRTEKRGVDEPLAHDDMWAMNPARPPVPVLREYFAGYPANIDEEQNKEAPCLQLFDQLSEFVWWLVADHHDNLPAGETRLPLLEPRSGEEKKAGQIWRVAYDIRVEGGRIAWHRATVEVMLLGKRAYNVPWGAPEWSCIPVTRLGKKPQVPVPIVVEHSCDELLLEAAPDDLGTIFHLWGVCPVAEDMLAERVADADPSDHGLVASWLDGSGDHHAFLDAAEREDWEKVADGQLAGFGLPALFQSEEYALWRSRKELEVAFALQTCHTRLETWEASAPAAAE